MANLQQITPTVSPSTSPDTRSSPLGSPFKPLMPLLSASLHPTSETPSQLRPAPIKYTTVDGVKKTLATLSEFNILLKRVIEEKDLPVFEVADFTAFFAERADEDIQKVADRRKGIKDLAEKHQLLLIRYNTYLRGILEELARCNLLTELEQIEQDLRKRTFPKESSSNSSPVRYSEKSTSGSEASGPLSEAWEKIGILAQLEADLEALKGKFNFVADEYPTDEFALEYRQYEAILFRSRFNEFTKVAADQSDPTKTWQKRELPLLAKNIDDKFENLKAEIEKVAFVPNGSVDLSTCKLSGRVKAIAEEFAENASLNDQVLKYRELYRAVHKMKKIVQLENTLEHRREAEDRIKLHERINKQLKELKSDVTSLDVGQAIEKIKVLMEDALKESSDIRKMFILTTKILEVFDKTVEKRKSDVKKPETLF